MADVNDQNLPGAWILDLTALHPFIFRVFTRRTAWALQTLRVVFLTARGFP